MLQWWDSLSSFSQVLACMAIPATLILFIQTVLMLIGIGSDGGADMDTDADVDLDVDTDVGDGVFGDELPDGDIDPSGLDGLRVFSVRGIIAFFVVFGWTGIALDSAGVAPVISSLSAILAGALMIVVIALVFRAIAKLENNGNIDNRNALGVAGTVYLKVPAKRESHGKVNVMIQGTLCERDAVTDEEADLPTGSEVVVVALSGQNTLVVKKK